MIKKKVCSVIMRLHHVMHACTGCCSHQMSCEQQDHMALELIYDSDTTLAEIAIKVRHIHNDVIPLDHTIRYII